MPRSNPWPTCS